MATLAQIQEFGLGNPKLKQRFQAARVQCAWDILAEPSPSPDRKAWQYKILNDVNADIDREYIWFLSHPNVQTSGDGITDAALVAATRSFVDSWAAYDASLVTP